MQQPIVRADRQRGRERVAVRGKWPVFDDDRLRRAGRTGRIDHVRGRARMHGHARAFRYARCAGLCGGGHRVGDVERVLERRAQRRAPGCIDDPVAQLRVADDPVEPGGRMARIERHEYAARLQHREQRDEQLARALDADADAHFGADAGCTQPLREPRCARIERAARQAQIVLERRRERGRIGRLLRQFADSVVQRSRETRHGVKSFGPAASAKSRGRFGRLHWCDERRARFFTFSYRHPFRIRQRRSIAKDLPRSFVYQEGQRGHRPARPTRSRRFRRDCVRRPLSAVRFPCFP
ncbi:hypothetical protein FEP79_06080 [Burkholderia multivorans]|nr:hypothetical protein [Burkholderia multivorans]